MFYIGLNAYGDKFAYFNTSNSVSDFRRIELRDMKLDCINTDEIAIIQYTTGKTTWTFTTLLLADFQNNLEAGNVNVSEQAIAEIKLKRRIKGETLWQDYITWEYNPDIRNYTYYDKYVRNAETYEYATVPVAVGGIEGRYNYAEITADFQYYYLMDKTHTYRLIYNATINSVKERILSSVSLPMGSKYPIVSSNSMIDFAEGSFSGLFYVEDLCGIDVNDTLGNINEARNYRNNFIAFLKNKKPKILKDESGNMYACKIHNDVSVEPLNVHKNAVTEISFPWIEIGDCMNIENLIKLGLVNPVI